MPLQTSGPISLLNIQNEFGGSNPISINEYYGVGYPVPVPASGAISLSDFYGKGPPFVWPLNYLGSLNSTNSPNSFNGTVRTPGVTASPVTYTINIDVSDEGGSATLQYYLSGALNQTYTVTNTAFFSTTHASTINSSSIQFRASNFQDDDTGGDFTYAQVNVATTRVFYFQYSTN